MNAIAGGLGSFKVTRIVFAAAVVALAFMAEGCTYDPDDYLGSSSSVVGALSLTASSTTIPADGSSRIDLMATISRNSASQRRTIHFSTSAGTLFGPGGVSGQSLDVVADSNGVAFSQLQSSTSPGKAIVQASVVNFPGTTKTLSIEFTP